MQNPGHLLLHARLVSVMVIGLPRHRLVLVLNAGDTAAQREWAGGVCALPFGGSDIRQVVMDGRCLQKCSCLLSCCIKESHSWCALFQNSCNTNEHGCRNVSESK